MTKMNPFSENMVFCSQHSQDSDIIDVNLCAYCHATERRCFDVTFRVGRTTMTWQRFAESKELALVSAMSALRAEYLDRKFVISDVKEAAVRDGSL